MVSVKVWLVVMLVQDVNLALRVTVCEPIFAGSLVKTVISPAEFTCNSVADNLDYPDNGVLSME